MLDAQFDGGSEGMRYEYELVYYPLTTDDGSPGGLKLPQPDRVVVYLNPCAWMVEDDSGKRMESFKFGEPTWQPANTHGGNTANVIEECHIVEVELR